VSGLIEILTC